MLADFGAKGHTGEVQPGRKSVVDGMSLGSLRWGRALFVAACLSATCATAVLGCSKRDDAAAVESLPALLLSDETPEVVLTWVDDQGAAHTSVTIADVPAANRQNVRVVTKDAGHGKLFYVADLSHKRDDGSYPVTTMPRAEWEARLDKLRQQALARSGEGTRPSTPHGLPAPNGPPGHQAPGQPHAQPSTGVHGTVYGASWCKPCHQAAAYMKKRGVAVTEHDIEKSPGKQREMQGKLRKSGRSGGSIPVIDIEGTILVGYSTRAIDNAIKRAQGTTRL